MKNLFSVEVNPKNYWMAGICPIDLRNMHPNTPIISAVNVSSLDAPKEETARVALANASEFKNKLKEYQMSIL